MANNSSDELNNRLDNLRDSLHEFLELTQLLEQIAAEFVRLGADPATSEILAELQLLIPELYRNHSTIQSEITEYQTNLGRQRLWTSREIEEAYRAIGTGIFRLRGSIEQLSTVAARQRQSIIEARLAQLSDLIFTLESTTTIARNQIQRLPPTHHQLTELRQSIALLEQDCQDCRQSFDLYVLIADQLPCTLDNTVELFTDLQSLIAVVVSSVELAQTICMDLLNSH